MSITIKTLEDTDEEYLFVRRTGFIAITTEEFLRTNKDKAFLVSEIQTETLQIYKDLQMKTPDMKMMILTNGRIGNVLSKMINDPTIPIYRKGSYYFYSQKKPKNKKIC